MNKMESILMLRIPFERRYQKRMRTALLKAIKPTLQQLKDGILPDNVNVEISIEEIKPVYYDLWQKTGLAFAQKQWFEFKKAKGYDYQKKDVEEEMFSDIWSEQMLNYARLNAGARITSITGSTLKFMKRNLKDLIRQTAEEGIGIDRISREVYNRMRTRVADYTLHASKRIAMTEVLGASNKGSFVGAQSTGYPMLKVWMTSPGISTVDRHVLYQGLEGQKKMITEPFEVGSATMMYPGAFDGPAEEVINCKCGVTYEVL